MKKYIILSINCNQDYIYPLPLAVWTWLKIGFHPIILFEASDIKGEYAKMRQLTMDYIEEIGGRFDWHQLGPLEGIRSSTVAQVSRLYGACHKVVNPEDYVMLGDVDLLALGNHWNPDYSKVTVWNWDLTGFSTIPMCFVGAPAKLWQEIMDMHMSTTDPNYYVKRDLENIPAAKSDDFYTYWGIDQEILTERLKNYGHDKITFINRGQGTHGFARGRVDRGHGGWVLNQPELIDCHMEQQTHHKKEKIERLYKLLGHVWPNEDMAWFHKFTEEYRKLTGHDN
jgi:hypothetical protein